MNHFNVFTEMILDTRRAKKGDVYPVKLRVTYQRKQVYYTINRLELLIKSINKDNPGMIKKIIKKNDFSQDEWDNKIKTNKPRGTFKEIAIELAVIEGEVNKIIMEMLVFSFQDFEQELMESADKNSVFAAYSKVIKQYYRDEKAGTASNYECSMNSLKSFANNEQLKFSDISAEYLNEYEKWMIDQGKSLTTVGIYLRPLRALFKKSTVKHYPFDDYQIPGKTNKKKSLSNADLKKLFEYQPKDDFERKALDYWKFSFLCGGMNLADIAKLKFSDFDGERFSFVRQKTAGITKGDQKVIEVTLHPIAKEIIERQGNTMTSSSDYVFPIYTHQTSSKELRLRRQTFISAINHPLKRIAKKLSLTDKISFYFARHSYATKLMRDNVPMQYISKSLGHESLRTTENYLGSFEQSFEQEVTNNLTNF